MPSLATARYGKDNVRVCKVVRDSASGRHHVVELTVCCLLEGAIESSYTAADNGVVIATDSIKNTIYLKAKEFPVSPPELYAARLGAHFLATYDHIAVAAVTVVQHRWTRMQVDGREHAHSFYRDGADTRTAEVRATRTAAATKAGGDGGLAIAVKSGLRGLTVLKSTGSAFHGFVRDDYTTLPETWDRVLSTEVDCTWSWSSFSDGDGVAAAAAKFDVAWDQARAIVMKLFAEDESASVQNTMYKMCEQILAAVPETELVSCSLPNKHYFEIDMSWHRDIKNTGKDAEVYAPQSGPNGLIMCEVSRT